MRRDAGFTIMEILIAIVILVVGLVGIMALFPAAIQSGNRTVEDSYAASIAQSVLDAINVGIRENRYDRDWGSGPVHFFIFQHDGIPIQDFTDLAQPGGSGSYLQDLNVEANARQAAGSDHRFLILLPTNETDTGTTFTFIYPKDDIGSDIRNPASNGLNDTTRDNPSCTVCANEHVREIYRLGTQNAFETDLPAPAGDDPYEQYGFTIKIRRAKIDANDDGRIDGSDPYSNNLFEVIIQVYRNFSEAPGSRYHQPIREFVTYVSM